MKLSDLFYLALGMMVVTYGVRLLPFVVMHKLVLPFKMKKFMSYIPYAALGALIFPGVFESIPGELTGVILGLGFAFFISAFTTNLLIPVVGSVLMVILTKFL